MQWDPWAAAVRQHAEAPQQVGAIGLNLYDYSNESRSLRTRQAIHNGEITYLTGDAECMPEVPTAAADVLLACMSVFHMRHPERAISEMDRTARPGSVAFLNVRGNQNVSDSPVMEQIYAFEDRGYGIDTRVGVVPRPGGGSWDTLFIRMEKP